MYFLKLEFMVPASSLFLLGFGFFLVNSPIWSISQEQFEMHETMSGKAPVILGGHEHTIFEEAISEKRAGFLEAVFNVVSLG